jgi:UDP-4-amino-4,6-dideoxy-N-acetyl-beta-L-altrosamine N-acetyltransferase
MRPPPDLDLRPLAEQPVEDQRALRAIRNEDAVRANMYDSDPIGADTHDAWLARIAADPACAYYLAYSEGRLIGMVGFSAINSTHRRADWAFYVSGAVQGRGLGAAMERAALALAFGPLGLNKLNCEVIDWNTGVITLHERFGFRREGLRREHVWRDGAFHDAVLLGLTRAEWEAR